MTDELISKNIGGYEVQRVIGRGGMATVYLARQQSMNRQVALKVLPKQFVNDDTYIQRFEREVAIVAKLEHRNIVPVYDYGEYDGLPYIVMRYMPAGSLDELLLDGPMPPDKVLSIVTQIAPALDYAHSKDVLHRDLKPSNVLLDDDGGAFITDFGIARLSADGISAITTQGVVGTPSYMSPEQAQGKPLDGRSDVYALGIVLFEMLTSRRPFESETPYSIAVMQVTTPPPSPRSFNPAISPALETVILKALRKQPHERYATATDLMMELRQAIEHPELVLSQDTQPAPPAHTKPAPQSVPLVGAPSSNPPIRYPTPSQPSRVSASYPVVQRGPISRLSQRRKTNPLVSVFIGGAIGCGLLGIVALFAALVIALALPGVFSSPEETPMPSPTQPPEAGVVITSPGTINPLPTLDPTSLAARETRVARGADIAATQTAEANAVTPLPSPTPGFAPVGVRGTPTLRPALAGVGGRLIFFDRRGDDVRSFELVSLNLDTWTETQLTLDESDNTYPVAAPDGRRVAFQSNRDGDFEIYVINTLGGDLRQITDNNYRDRLPTWSPDGEWLLYSADVRGDETYDLMRTRLSDGTTEPVLSNGQRNSHARYSPDGRYIVFTTGSDPLDAATWEIALLDTETGDVTQLTDNDVRDASPVFSPDGRQILYVSFQGTNNALYVMNIDGTNARLLFDSVGSEWAASYSPDGRYIVFTSTVTGEDELFLMTAQGTDVQQITSSGGSYASWIPDP